MNKFIKGLFVLPVVLGLAACNNQNTSNSTNSSQNGVSSNGSTPVAQTWEVSYYYNYEGNNEKFDYQYIVDGNKATKPSKDPTREGFYKFTSWYKDAYCLIEFDFDTEVITAPTSIYAGWEEVEDPSLGFDLIWTETAGVEYVDPNGETLPTHVEDQDDVSFKVNILEGYEGSPVVRANGTQLMPTDGVYTLENISTKTTITVENVKQNVTTNPDDVIQISYEYFVFANGVSVGQMVENESTLEGIEKEYMFTYDFNIDDTIVIYDGLGRQFTNWENGGEFISGSPIIVTTAGTYTFYLKIYESKISIWIEAPLSGDYEYTTIYYTNPNNWSTVYCYTWLSDGSYAYFGNWPGKQMAKDSETGYYYIENVIVGENIIFNNGEGSQTADLVVPTDGNNTFATAWGTLDNIPDVIVPTGETTTVYYTNPSSWSTVYCYTWTSALGETYFGSWPGTPMSYDSESGLWYIENVLVGENIIFNNGNGGTGNQTADLVVPTDGNNTFDGNTWTTTDGTVSGGGSSTPTTPVEPTGEYYTIYFTLPTDWDPAATNPRIYYWGSQNSDGSLFNNGAASNMTLESGSTYYINIDTSISLSGLILIFDQGTEVKQSFDITDVPTTAGEYEITMTGEWSQNTYEVWCFVATLSAK